MENESRRGPGLKEKGFSGRGGGYGGALYMQDGSVIKGTVALAEEPSSVPSIYIGQFLTEKEPGMVAHAH